MLVGFNESVFLEEFTFEFADARFWGLLVMEAAQLWQNSLSV